MKQVAITDFFFGCKSSKFSLEIKIRKYLAHKFVSPKIELFYDICIRLDFNVIVECFHRFKICNNKTELRINGMVKNSGSLEDLFLTCV